MKEAQRRTLLLVSFMVMLAVVVLFVLVYAAEPLELSGPAINLPEPYSSIVNATVQGWTDIYDTFSGMNATTSYPG